MHQHEENTIVILSSSLQHLLDLHFDTQLGGPAEELLHKVVGPSTFSQLATTTDSLAFGQTTTLGTVSTAQLTVSVLLECLDSYLLAHILQGQAVPRGAVTIGCILVVHTVELLLLLQTLVI